MDEQVSLLDDLLIKATGEGARYWMDFVGKAIFDCTDQFTRGSRPAVWLAVLSAEVWDRIRTRHDWKVMDENIVCSKALSLILALWSCRVVRAKAYDNRRPLEARKGMLDRLTEFCMALTRCMVDESRDHVYFPAQDWSPPFPPLV